MQNPNRLGLALLVAAVMCWAAPRGFAQTWWILGLDHDDGYYQRTEEGLAYVYGEEFYHYGDFKPHVYPPNCGVSSHWPNGTQPAHWHSTQWNHSTDPYNDPDVIDVEEVTDLWNAYHVYFGIVLDDGDPYLGGYYFYGNEYFIELDDVAYAYAMSEADFRYNCYGYALGLDGYNPEFVLFWDVGSYGAKIIVDQFYNSSSAITQGSRIMYFQHQHMNYIYEKDQNGADWVITSLVFKNGNQPTYYYTYEPGFTDSDDWGFFNASVTRYLDSP